MISIAFLNFSGISMTKEVSATARMVLDSVRTFFIWIICLMLKWQDFHPLQVSVFTQHFILLDVSFHYFTSHPAPVGIIQLYFFWVQLLGFGVLLLGMIIYYQIISFGGIFARVETARPEDEEIISQPADQP